MSTLLTMSYFELQRVMLSSMDLFNSGNHGTRDRNGTCATDCQDHPAKNQVRRCGPCAGPKKSVGTLAGQQFAKTDVFTGTQSPNRVDLFRQDLAPAFGIFPHSTIVYENPVNLAQNE